MNNPKISLEDVYHNEILDIFMSKNNQSLLDRVRPVLINSSNDGMLVDLSNQINLPIKNYSIIIFDRFNTLVTFNNNNFIINLNNFKKFTEHDKKILYFNNIDDTILEINSLLRRYGQLERYTDH